MLKQHTISNLPYKDFSLKIHEQAGSQDRVVKAQLELTYRCNLHCVHCYTDPYNAREFFPRELTVPEIKHLLDEMAEIGILWLNLTGGEIFTHPHFFEIYEYAFTKGFLLQLYTNGTIFTNAMIDRLKASPPFSIDISCHSVNEEAFDRFTQVPGSFKQFMKSMELLRHSGLPLSFKTKAMNWNIDELPNIQTFIESFHQPFGISTSLSPRLNGDCSSLDYRLGTEDVEFLEQTSDTFEKEESCNHQEENLPFPSDSLFRCGCGTNTIHVSAWGELSTCTMQYEQRVSIRDCSLREAIDKVFKEVHTLRYTSDSPCKTCRIVSFCDKKPTEARWETGHAEAPIPYDCDVAFIRAKHALPQAPQHPLITINRKAGIRGKQKNLPESTSVQGGSST